LLFNSITFAIFLVIVLATYWMLRFRGQNILLLVASWVFYAFWDWRFLGLLIFQSLIDFIAGLAIGNSDDEKFRKRVLIAAISLNLLILGFFKYFGFFVDSAVNLLEWFGLNPNPPLLEVLLPIGISFYTFQSITYSFDVYRRRLPPTRSLLNYSVFVAYFPHMVAGPIQRANHLLPQIEKPRVRPSIDKIRSGLFLILLGLFKKVAIADACAIVAAKAFDAPNDASSALLLVGLIAFALQIYGDFAGYTDIARGVSRLFGIELTLNFEQPYLSRNITEFWRTWHISLSTWLHDYLYIPLGGNQHGKFVTYRNLMITMLLGGLWHGASWNFVIWGGIHGALLSIHRAMGGYVPRGHLDPLTWRDILKILFTFALVCLAWVFFRSLELTDSVDYITGLFSFRAGGVALDDLLVVGISLLFILIIDISQRLTRDQEVVLRWAPPLRGIAYATLFIWIVLWSGGEAQPFIYFQF
jgi:D-alanyl-lipoteichoic acid acyltransferase DltB (MBOAT superfamily)